MATFHENPHELHGITVVVETEGPLTYIGRCHDMDDEKVVLKDVDEHDEGRDEATKQEFISKAAQIGVWAKHKHLVLPRAEVKTVRRLGDVGVS
jgi:hypothetical protein